MQCKQWRWQWLVIGVQVSTYQVQYQDWTQLVQYYTVEVVPSCSFSIVRDLVQLRLFYVDPHVHKITVVQYHPVVHSL